MARRRRKTGISLDKTQDPGKDLFAYLFLLIMVFSFMLLMTTEDRRETISGQTAPQKHEATSRSTLTAVSVEKIGRLVRKDESLFLSFGNVLYHPLKDVERLIQEDRVSVITGEGGRQERILYLEEDKETKVLLGEYLKAFQSLSMHNIGVAFAERVE